MTPPGNTVVSTRRATRADGPTLGRLGALLVRTHHDFDAERFIAPTSRTAQGYGGFLASQVDDEDVIVLVAERESEVVGYTYAEIDGFDYTTLRGPAGVIHDIIVSPANRGEGVGRMLLDATIAALVERGAPRVVLETAARNEAAQRLFARAGFRRTMIEMTRETDVGAP